MSDEKNPPSLVDRVITGGLPQIIAGPAGLAISRLIAGATEIPVAWLEQRAQRIRDETDARTTVLKAAAEAAAKQASLSPDIIDRGLDRWARELGQKQANREAVAEKAVEDLKVEPPSPEATGPTEDWMNNFGAYAEKATTEEVRGLWSKILAGEIRRPGSFSLITLQFLAVVDADLALLIEKVIPFVLDGSFIPLDFMEERLVSESDLIELEQLGIGSYAAGFMTKNKTPENKVITFSLGDTAVLMRMKSEDVVPFRCFSLNIIGREIDRLNLKDRKTDEIVKYLWSKEPESMAIGSVDWIDKTRYKISDIRPLFRV